MHLFKNTRFLVTAFLCSASFINGQQSAVPRMVRFSGTFHAPANQPHAPVGATFAVFNQQEGGVALWTEEQNVEWDSAGTYAVLLGSTKNEGLPAELFGTSNEPRWLQVTFHTPAEVAEPRVLLVSVPYALKAVDADTLGGKPASAYLTAPAPAPTSAQPQSPGAAEAPGAPAHAARAASAVEKPATIQQNYIPVFTNTSGSLVDSVMYQNGNNIGIGTTSAQFPLTLQTSATGYTFLEELIGTVDPGAGATRLQVGNPVSQLMLTAYGSQSPGILGGSAGLVSLLGPLLIGNAAAGKPLYLYAGNNFNAPQFTLTSTGRIGIGTTTPQAPIQVNFGSGTSGSALIIQSSPGINSSPGGAALQAQDTAGSVFRPLRLAGSPAYFDSGNVGISTTTPAFPLTVCQGGSCYAPPPPYFPFTNTAASASYGFTASSGTMLNGGNGILAQGGQPDPEDFNALAGSGIAGIGGSSSTGNANQQAGDGGVFLGGNSTNGIPGDGLYAAPGSGPMSGSHAGFFAGGVNVVGDLGVTGTITAGMKNFKVDHPLDPANKYLFHSSVESSEMMNIYTGNVTTDAQGDARVELPSWFGAVNTDFRYQLTVVGQFAQAIVSSEVANNTFGIKTDKPNVKVSWQITAVRQDAYAKAHPLVVEQEKDAIERGHYIHPELYGASQELSVNWARHHPLPAAK